MNQEIYNSFIKFKEVTVKFDENDQPAYSKFFIFPAKDYNDIIKHDFNKVTNYDYCLNIDKFNVITFFNEHLKYGEELRLLWDRREQFDSEIFEKRYKKTKSLLMILCRFILTMISNLYYANLWMFEEKGIVSSQKKNVIKNDVQYNVNIDTIFRDGKSQDFNFDLSIQYAMKMEKKMKIKIYKMLDHIFPPINDKQIVENVFANSEQRKEIKKEVKKDMKVKNKKDENKDN